MYDIHAYVVTFVTHYPTGEPIGYQAREVVNYNMVTDSLRNAESDLVNIEVLRVFDIHVNESRTPLTESSVSRLSRPWLTSCIGVS